MPAPEGPAGGGEIRCRGRFLACARGPEKQKIDAAARMPGTAIGNDSDRPARSIKRFTLAKKKGKAGRRD